MTSRCRTGVCGCSWCWAAGCDFPGAVADALSRAQWLWGRPLLAPRQHTPNVLPRGAETLPATNMARRSSAWAPLPPQLRGRADTSGWGCGKAVGHKARFCRPFFGRHECPVHSPRAGQHAAIKAPSAPFRFRPGPLWKVNASAARPKSAGPKESRRRQRFFRQKTHGAPQKRPPRWRPIGELELLGLHCSPSEDGLGRCAGGFGKRLATRAAAIRGSERSEGVSRAKKKKQKTATCGYESCSQMIANALTTIGPMV